MKINATLFLFCFLSFDMFWNRLYLYMLQHSKGKDQHRMKSQSPPHPSPLTEFSFPKATSIASFLSILYELYEMLCYIYNNYVYFTQVLFTICSVLHIFFFYKIYLKVLPYKSITRSLHLFNDSFMFHCTDVRKYT